MITRRAFFETIVGGLLVGPLAAGAQQTGRAATIAVLALGPEPTPKEIAGSPFLTKLRELGWEEGRNLRVVRRYTERAEDLSALARALVGSRPDLILVGSAGIASIVKRETETIPIVAWAAGDLVTPGLVASLRRPGGNVTGVQILQPELLGKRLELLREIVTRLERIGALNDVATTGGVQALSERNVEELRTAARALGSALLLVTVRERGELSGAFDDLAQRRSQAVLVVGSPWTLLHRREIGELAVRHRLPTICELGTFVTAGCLMSYGVNWDETLRQSAVIVDKIFRGAKPADLPVEQPTKFELVINLKTAKALGLTTPQSLLLRADQVIE